MNTDLTNILKALFREVVKKEHTFYSQGNHKGVEGVRYLGPDQKQM